MDVCAGVPRVTSYQGVVMRVSLSTVSFALLFWGSFGLLPSAVATADRSAEAILKDIDGVEMPDVAKVDRKDQEAVQKFLKDRRKAMSKKAGLISELGKVAPDHEKLVTLLPERWQILVMTGTDSSEIAKEEVAEVLSHAKSDKLKAEAAFFNAMLLFRGREKADKQLSATEDFIKRAPKDPRAAMLLYAVAKRLPDQTAQTDLYKRITKEYPDSEVASEIQASLKQLESIGKPFTLDFTDAIKGTEISFKTTLKGKVVVVDFWATWCGPCVAEMPNMKKLYAEYHDKGVEFVGVSLDSPKEEGGLDELKDFVAKNEIPWPQYYQGNGWNSEFSKSWGINAIPALFVVDAEGKLFSVEARGKLEEMLPELLKKAKAEPAPAGGN